MIDTTQIKEGMTVYDEDDNKIGTVDYVQYTDEDYNKPGPETVSTASDPRSEMNILKSFAQALGAEDDMPTEVREYYERYGYIRLKSSGIFDSDYYVTLNNVSAIIGDNIHLTTTKDELMAV